MSKKTLIQADTNSYFITTQNPSFIQAKNKLISSTKQHVKKTGFKSNIIAEINNNDYVSYTTPIKGNSLIRGRRGIKNSIVQGNTMQANSMQGNTMHGDNILNGSINKRTRIFSRNSNSSVMSINTSTIQHTIQNVNKVDIFTTGPTASFAQIMAIALTNCGIRANIFIRNINNADIAVCAREKGRYLLICSPQILLQTNNEPIYPENLSSLPVNKYFLYQFENLSRKNPSNLNPHIVELIKNAKHTFDCSPANMSYYPKECRGRVSVLQPNNSIDYMKKNLNIKLLYPALFHKYILGLRNPDENLITKNYSVFKEASITRQNICHIHCFYLKNLDSMFSAHISLIQQTFDIIVTYTHQDDSILNKYNNITFLRVNNYGMDIGPKFTVYEYLSTKNINYNYVFYIHSKTDIGKRNMYLLPFINNIGTIQQQINDKYNVCYFNNIILNGDGINNFKWSKFNKLYMNDILNYLKVKTFKDDTQFEEGNFYLLNKKIIDILFSDKLLYNILNENNSFDYNWVYCFYKLTNNPSEIYNINDVYNKYITRKLYGNNITTQRGHQGLADAMVEHIFERLPLILCKENNVQYSILS